MSLIREMQIKTKKRYHLTPVRMVIIIKSKTSDGEDLNKEEPYALLVGMQIGAAAVENSMDTSRN